DADPKVRVAALVCALCVDLTVFYARASVETPGVPVRLSVLWGFALLRFWALAAATRLTLGRVRRLLLRVITAHSLLPAVFETGSTALYPGEEAGGRCGRLADARCWLLFVAASLSAALFWEVTIPDSDEDAAAAAREQKKKARVQFLRVVKLYRPDYPLLGGGLVFLTLAVVCEMSIPFYTGQIIDILGSQYQRNQFRSALLFMGLYSLGSSLSAGCRGGILTCAIGSFTCRMKLQLFGALTKQEIGFFEVTKPGDITNRLSNDTVRMGESVCLNVNVLLRTFIRTVGMITLMMSLSWKLTLLILLETPVTGLVQNIYDTHDQRLQLAMQDSMAEASEAVREVLSNVNVVRSFNAEQHEAGRYGRSLVKTQDLKTRRGCFRAVSLLVQRLTGLCTQVLMLYYGRQFIQSGQMTVGSLLSFMLYQSDVGTNIRTLVYCVGATLKSVGAAERVFEYMDRRPVVSTDGTLRPDDLSGHVRFNRLTFAYPSNPDRTVLQDLSLELKPGRMTALVGPSGGGKTTCVSLLERFYEPQAGEILLDNEPLKSYDHGFLHRKVAMVGQDPVLFSGSIRDNIAYGLTDCSMEEVQEAARLAHAHDFIQQMGRGYDTEVGEGGGQLSKSEKQRIAIARALVRRPQIIILDEITSSLDTESESEVQQALSGLPDRTLLVIAHKLSTIEKADQIVVISGGVVEDRGSHQDLMEKKGSYYKLVEKLFAE
uniref:Transporter associated with antigen processing, subunit type a n=1 Tax=Cynoglossus semilaevis TaxID=244447 RepID=A0A3P8X0C2_CYNSE